MPAYPSGGGSNIGTLLRLIQEDQNKSIAATPPSADPASPLRGVIQQPIEAPEAPGSERVISIRPEGAIQQGPQASEVVAPSSPALAQGPVAGNVVAPSRPVAPAVSFDGGSVSPSVPQSNSVSRASSLSASAPAIGTSIRPSSNANFTAQVARPSTARPSAPQQSSFRQPSTSKSGGSLGAIGGTIGGGSASGVLTNLIRGAAPFLETIVGGALKRLPIFLTKPQADFIKLQGPGGSRYTKS